MATRLFIVEDRDALRRMMERALEGEGYTVATAVSGDEAITRLATERFDLVITDLKLPGASGIEVLAASRSHQPQVPVVVLTGFGTVSTAVEAMKLGAADFLEKPLEIDTLFDLVRALVAEESGSAVFTPPGGAPPIIGRHPKLKLALRMLRKVATTESTVLLTGESGTGKELFARALHALSLRADGPFVAVNCAAIPEALMENELFGHEKGAFTGAARRQAGRFELARGGTLLLDEIGELSPAVQGKVLRVLETRTFERVGSGRSLDANVRIVAATNRDLKAMSDAGTFRADLYFRLDVFPIELPPLRARREDVPALARHLLGAIAKRLGQPPPELMPAALDLLVSQPWPGNVRQLANLLERATILAEGPALDLPDLRPLIAPVAESDERQELCHALRTTDGEKKRAAALLGISYRTLQRKIRAFDLEGFPRYRR